jgi:hypothetical protein
MAALLWSDQGARERAREVWEVRGECSGTSTSVEGHRTHVQRGRVRARAWLPHTGQVSPVEALRRARGGQRCG